MSSTNQAVLAQAQKLMREGKVQEADDLLGKEITSQKAADVASGATPPAPPPPRKPDEIIVDLLRMLVLHLGNRTELVKLVNELEAALAPPSPTPTPKPTPAPPSIPPPAPPPVV